MIDFDHEEIFETFEEEFQKKGRRRRSPLPIPPWIFIIILLAGVGVFILLRSTSTLDQVPTTVVPGSGTQVTTELLVEAAALTSVALTATPTGTLSVDEVEIQETLAAFAQNPAISEISPTAPPVWITSGATEPVTHTLAVVDSVSHTVAPETTRENPEGIDQAAGQTIDPTQEITPGPVVENRNLFQRIGGFFSNLFGGGSKEDPKSTETSVPPTATPDNTEAPQPTALTEEPSWEPNAAGQGDSTLQGTTQPFVTISTGNIGETQPSEGTPGTTGSSDPSAGIGPKGVETSASAIKAPSDLDDEALKFEEDTATPTTTATKGKSALTEAAAATMSGTPGDGALSSGLAAQHTPSATVRAPIQGLTITALPSATGSSPMPTATATIAGTLSARNQILSLSLTPPAATEAARKLTLTQSVTTPAFAAATGGPTIAGATTAPQALAGTLSVRATALPDTGFADAISVPMLVLIVLVLAGIILTVRIIRGRTS